MLASTRNNLLYLEIRIAILTLGFGSAAYFAGLGGMNLLNGYEDAPGTFWPVAGAITAVGLTVSLLGSWKLRRWQRSWLPRVHRKPS